MYEGQRASPEATKLTGVTKIFRSINHLNSQLLQCCLGPPDNI